MVPGPGPHPSRLSVQRNSTREKGRGWGRRAAVLAPRNPRRLHCGPSRTVSGETPFFFLGSKCSVFTFRFFPSVWMTTQPNAFPVILVADSSEKEIGSFASIFFETSVRVWPPRRHPRSLQTLSSPQCHPPIPDSPVPLARPTALGPRWAPHSRPRSAIGALPRDDCPMFSSGEGGGADVCLKPFTCPSLFSGPSPSVYGGGGGGACAWGGGVSKG